MLHFTCLGYSEATIAMLMESLYSHYQTNFEMIIVQNMPLPAQHAFAIEGVKYEIVLADSWQARQDTSFLMGVGAPKIKQIIFDFFAKKYPINTTQYESLVHLSSQIAQTATVGEGTHINPLCVLAPFAQVGKLVTINRGVTIGHHTQIADFCTIAPSASIAGHCEIGSHTSIGIGATILDYIKVGKNTIVGAGSVVTKNLPDNVVAYGNPAKIIRENV